MQKQDKQNPLFIVHNHHVASCGEPPSLDGDDGRYYAYFENSYREQLVYVCDPTTRDVITSYSIHYTKLYEATRRSPSSGAG